MLSALAGGFVGTLVMVIITRAATEMGLTRMDLPFLLGTIVTEDRRRAKAIGYGFHLIMGLIFSLVYWAFFAIIGRSSWWIGGLAGALQALFISTVLVNELLPVDPSKDGDLRHRRESVRADRAARFPDAQLRPQYVSGDARRAHRVRGDRRSSGGTP